MRFWRECLCVVLCVSCSASGVTADELEAKVARWKKEYEARVLPIIRERCQQCHNAEKSEGELDLSKFATGDQAYEAADAWERVARRIRLNEMPPQGSPGLNDRQKGTFQKWVDTRPNQDLCSQLASEETQSWYRGYVMSRRLTQLEYRNAVRDLLGQSLPAGEEPPVDGAGGEGFDTVGDSLFTSTLHTEAYLLLADQLVDRALPAGRMEQWLSGVGEQSGGVLRGLLSESQWRLLDTAASADAAGVQSAVQQLIAGFARRAWRRPPTEEEVTRLQQLFAASLPRLSSVLESVRQPLKAVLVSPHFLFVVETEPDETGVLPLTGHQLATRLALFLWSSVPDEELLAAADAGVLADDRQYRQQIRRMLADSKSAGLGENFGLQWLGLRNFGGVVPDAEVYPQYSELLAGDLREEAVQFVSGVFRENRPLTDLLAADYVVVNGRLAQHYGLSLPADADWQRVVVADGRRGGAATLGAVLTAASYPRRTSPVLRGRWILDELLGTPVPPPPPGVPPLDQSVAESGSQTLRQRLELHRQKPECASCHDRMDPLGFGLENFDGIGRWRESDAGQSIDAAGRLPSGEQFAGPAELKAVLLGRKDDFLNHFSRKMLGFALGRELNKFDACVVETSVKKLQENGFQSQILIEEIACSYPFRNRYYKKSDPPPDPAGGRGSRLMQALQRFSEKAAEAQKKAAEEKAAAEKTALDQAAAEKAAEPAGSEK
ncbi:hypothetical protein LBMAG46_35340 [Planctomycetia bacterium]|nr:hypothetical protein LBMAG46_35340 [Planctomycetia bacterium]